MNGFTALFMGNPPLDFDEDSGKPTLLNISTHIYGSVPQEDTRLDLWYPDGKRKTECVAAYASLYPLMIYYLNRLNDWGLYFRKCKICGKVFLAKSQRYELCSDCLLYTSLLFYLQAHHSDLAGISQETTDYIYAT